MEYAQNLLYMINSAGKSPRNKTISLSDDEITRFSSNLVNPSEQLQLKGITDKIIIGDLLEVIDFLPTKFVDLMIIDPPYNLDKGFGNMNFKEISNDSYIAYLESWFPKLLPLLKDNASVYVCCDWKSSSAIYEVLSKYLIVRNRITWEREKGRGAKANWKNSCEDIWFATTAKDYYFDIDKVKVKRKVIAPYKVEGKPKDWEETEDGGFRLTHPSNFWNDVSVPYWSMPENTPHPTQKPEKLIAKLILASCPESGFVFDPFIGSGTTLVTAKKLGHSFAGVELNKDFCCYAEKRLEMAGENKRIQGYHDGVFWERNSLSQQKK